MLSLEVGRGTAEGGKRGAPGAPAPAQPLECRDAELCVGGAAVGSARALLEAAAPWGAMPMLLSAGRAT